MYVIETLSQATVIAIRDNQIFISVKQRELSVYKLG